MTYNPKEHDEHGGFNKTNKIDKIDGLIEVLASMAQEEEALAKMEKSPEELSSELVEVDAAEAPLPPVFQRGLRSLLSDIRETNAARSGEVSADDEAEVVMTASLQGSTESAAIGPVAIEEPAAYGAFSIAPHWVHCEGEGSVALPVAAVEVKEAHTFDFRDAGYPGAVSCELQLETEYEGEGLLRFRWSADHVPADGWWVAVYTLQNSKPCFEELLGNDAKGEVVFPAALLGFDPSTTPFRYLLYPR